MKSLRAIGLGGAVVLLASGASAQQLVISNWDGDMAPDLLENCTNESGVEVLFWTHANNEEIMGKIVAAGGQGYDLVFVSGQFAEALNELGYAAHLDHEKIPNLANLYPEAKELAYDKGNVYSVPYAWGTTGLCYRSDLIDEPASLMALLDPAEAVAGKTTMLATDRCLMGAGLLALGHSVNETDETKLNEARDLLIEAKKTLLAYDDTTFYAKLVSGEAVLVQAWDGWCNYGIAENGDIKYVVPSEGSDLWTDTMVVMEKSGNKAAAHAFIDYVLRPDVGVWVASNILYKTPNEAAMIALDPELVKAFPNLGMTPDELLKYEQLRDLGEGQKAFTRAVQEVLAAQ